ncbi:MAG: glycosyltransferase [Bacteroidota bacterium]
MKKVLIVSYYFPPSGGPGVQRVLKFVKYLPVFGWQPVVLTVENGDFPARDESLLKEIPPTVTVYRTKIFEPYSLYRKLTGKAEGSPVDVENIPGSPRKRSLTESFAAFIRSTFFIPDARIGWYPYATTEGLEIIRNEGIQAIYSSSPPYTTAVIARRLHQMTKLPWIAGFRDPWTGFLSTPDRWFFPAAVDRYLESSVIRDATIIEAAWRGILKDIMKKNSAVDCTKLFHLPNGFDSEDYPPVDREPGDRFVVTYTGSLYGKRNPEMFLKAVEELVAEGSVDPGRILLQFIGRFGAEVRDMVERSGIRQSVRLVPYLPHAESIKELLRSDALLLIVDNARGSEEIVPGKVYEYIGARRPIIALAPEGAVAELIRETRSGFVAEGSDVGKIKSAFLEYYRKFPYDTPAIEQDMRAVQKYERREITRHLASLLDAVTSRPPVSLPPA